jgi:hypothetical protein
MISIYTLTPNPSPLKGEGRADIKAAHYICQTDGVHVRITTVKSGEYRQSGCDRWAALSFGLLNHRGHRGHRDYTARNESGTMKPDRQWLIGIGARFAVPGFINQNPKPCLGCRPANLHPDFRVW